MADYDLIVRNAKIVTEDRQAEGDIGVKDGRIAAIEPGIKGKATREIDAAGKFVLPGGIDSHVHVEQRSGFGIMCADDFYTGTVSAAFEGAILGIPSIAVSSVPFDDIDYSAIARFTRKLAKKVLESGLPDFSLLNVNAPSPTNGKFPGIKITRLGKRVYRDIIVEKIDPRGKKYYWIAGEPEWRHFDQSDFSATNAGFISITPLKMDMTDYALMQQLEKWKL